ncbi:uncharacterized protein B0H18DRAFT_1018466 [Fomitopsis serialis]|uniref:uncharacterized protein n=1 Tax=Fomitopsis serialis TaxID=139415 RepID=UPI002008C56C|nr:uncharacterized protein B0H18DRAFT_1018466 [Neoantrodia serialis]KAH9922196.1 hypothetical protein B0H18DRAFT_1018466 [Neoantrodia serialis]
MIFCGLFTIFALRLDLAPQSARSTSSRVEVVHLLYTSSHWDLLTRPALEDAYAPVRSIPCFKLSPSSSRHVDLDIMILLQLR